MGDLNAAITAIPEIRGGLAEVYETVQEGWLLRVYERKRGVGALTRDRVQAGGTVSERGTSQMQGQGEGGVKGILKVVGEAFQEKNFRSGADLRGGEGPFSHLRSPRDWSIGLD